MRMIGWLLSGWCLVSVAGVAGCSPSEPREAPPAQQTPPPMDHAAMMAHSDHTPRFGGLVLMDGDLHFEVVAHASGQYRVYFSDAQRAPLPASSVTDAVVTVMRPEGDAEVVPLQRDATDASWIGEGRPVESDETIVRVGYVHQGQPYWIDLPFRGFTMAGSSATPPGAP